MQLFGRGEMKGRWSMYGFVGTLHICLSEVENDLLLWEASAWDHQWSERELACCWQAATYV